MTRIILDFGSANTCNNNENYAKCMIDELARIDNKKHEVIIKWQLWNDDNPQDKNKRLDWLLFHAMVNYAWDKYCYMTTASVFDVESINFIQSIPLKYSLPFIKIACREDLFPLIAQIYGDDVYVSQVNPINDHIDNITYLSCVPKYPADIKEYKKFVNISDHTKDLELFKKFNPEIIEMHYALKDSVGLDAKSGVCKTPEMLKEIL